MKFLGPAGALDYRRSPRAGGPWVPQPRVCPRPPWVLQGGAMGPQGAPKGLWRVPWVPKAPPRGHRGGPWVPKGPSWDPNEAPRPQ